MPSPIFAQPVQPSRSHLGTRPLPMPHSIRPALDNAEQRASWAAPLQAAPDLAFAILCSFQADGDEATLRDIASALALRGEQIGKKPGATEQWISSAFAKASEETILLARQCKDATE